MYTCLDRDVRSLLTGSADIAVPITPHVTRRAWLAVSVMLFVFVTYSSVLPFEFSPISLPDAWDRFLAAMLLLGAEGPSRSDFIANALLFVPFGFALAGGLASGRGQAARFVFTAGVLPISVAASASVEFLQVFTPKRIPSSTDMAAQTLGAFIGAGGWLAVGDPLSVWVRNAVVSQREDRLLHLLKFYAAGWVFVNLAPLDITVDVADIARRLRLGQISLVPFAGGFPSARAGWDAFAGVIAAAPIGALATMAPRRADTFRAIALGACAVASLEIAQTVVMSHSATADDLIFGCTGVIAGVAFANRISKNRGEEVGTDTEARTAIHWLAVLLATAWYTVLILYHWMPYDFVLEPTTIRTKLAAMSLLPFAGYRAGSYLNGLNDFLTKATLAVPLGFAFGFVSQARACLSGYRLWVALLGAAFLFAVLELGQFFLPTRIPDPTDVLIGVGGTFLGIRIANWLRSGSGRPRESKA